MIICYLYLFTYKVNERFVFQLYVSHLLLKSIYIYNILLSTRKNFLSRPFAVLLSLTSTKTMLTLSPSVAE